MLTILFWIALLIAAVIVIVRLADAARHRRDEDLFREMRERYAAKEADREEGGKR